MITKGDPAQKRAETALRNRLLRLGWTLRPATRPALTVYDWHNPTAPASLVRILADGVYRPEWELRIWDTGPDANAGAELIVFRAGRNPLALAREAMRESALLDSRLRLGWQPRLATDTGEVEPPKPRRSSGEVDGNGYGANMYGCQPCPRCRSIARAVTDATRKIILCHDCWHTEPVTRIYE